MSEYTPAQIDWMKHGLLILNERLGKPKGLSVEQIAELRREAGQRKAVLHGIDYKQRMVGELAVVAAYMVAHADLQIERYARRIDEATFRAGVEAARAKMDAALSRVKVAA